MNTGWPALNYAAWRDTAATLQLWTQIVGKVRLALTPWLNHGWQVPLYVNAHGVGSGPIHADGRVLEIDFDLVAHRLVVRTSDTPDAGFALEPMAVATFYARLMAVLDGVGIDVAIDLMPNEVAKPIRFPDDHGARCLRRDGRRRPSGARCCRPIASFVCSAPRFLGKASPVHLFWGSFDLAVTRFSGRPAPLHPGGVPGLPDAVTREAYSHEVSSAGFWPGSDAYPQAAFYSYAYPSPAGFAAAEGRTGRGELGRGDGRMAAALRRGAHVRRPRRDAAALPARRPIAPPPTWAAGAAISMRDRRARATAPDPGLESAPREPLR